LILNEQVDGESESRENDSMSKKVFISYRHGDAAWVRDTLYPVLSAGGAQVVVDYKDFDAGIALRKQISEKQAIADVHLLVLTPDYFTSAYCLEEMRRAAATDPQFEKGTVLPIVLQQCVLPPEIKGGEPLHVDLSGARNLDAEGWDRVMKACGADLGMSPPHWLRAYLATRKALEERRSVNLLVKGHPKWRELIDLLKLALPELGVVDLESGKTATQRGLVGEILRALVNFSSELPRSDEHLAEFERLLEAASPTLLALKHFDRVRERKYDGDLYSSLRYLIMEKRRLTLLVESRGPFATLLPKNHALSFLEMETVELNGRP
jgi:hypothetical protein